MKGCTLLLNLFLLLWSTELPAQTPDHLIGVKRFSDYGRDYLTIVDPKLYWDSSKKSTEQYGYDFMGKEIGLG